jgi:hypothetical protein
MKVGKALASGDDPPPDSVDAFEPVALVGLQGECTSRARRWKPLLRPGRFELWLSPNHI